MVDGDAVTVLYDVPAGTVTTFSLNDYRTQADTLTVPLRPITITKTFSLKETARAFFAKVGAEVSEF